MKGDVGYLGILTRGIWQLGCGRESQEFEINSVGSFCFCEFNEYHLYLHLIELLRLPLVHLT